MLDDLAFTRMQLTAYEAACEPHLWAVLMHDLCDSVPATTACLFVAAAGVEQRFIATATGRNAATQNDVAERVGSSSRPVLRPVTSLPTTQPASVRSTGSRVLVTTVVEGDARKGGVPSTHLALTRSRNLPGFGEKELRFLGHLGKPLKAAVQSYFALERNQAVEHSVAETMEALPQPLYALSDDGGIVYANDAGRTLLGTAAGVMHVHDRRLRGVGNLTGTAWAWALDAGLSGVHRPLPFWYIEREGVRSGVVRIGPLAYSSPLPGRWGAARLLMSIELDDAPQRRTARLAGMVRHYGLTPSETSVLGQLRDGRAPEAAARELGVQLSTVRSHVRHLMEKTATRRMAELVALLA